MGLTRDDYRRIALRVINYGMNSRLVADQFTSAREGRYERSHSLSAVHMD
ncbi:MAG: hypothetical protein ACXQTD_02345 [Candidatus Syntropharchaeia archaeon]